MFLTSPCTDKFYFLFDSCVTFPRYNNLDLCSNYTSKKCKQSAFNFVKEVPLPYLINTNGMAMKIQAISKHNFLTYYEVKTDCRT